MLIDTTMISELENILTFLSPQVPAIREALKGKELSCRKTRNRRLTVRCTPHHIHITASTTNAFLRGVLCAACGLEVDETIPFDSLCVMLDCSRNRVFTVPYVKSLILNCALAGASRFMLYTEDVYQLPDEPAFGYMRGKYTAQDLQDLKAYAEKLGVELIPCIQTLGHLKHLFNHSQYAEVHDDAEILLADEPQTYQLIEKMIRFHVENLKPKFIHLGMDETHRLGRGKHLDRFGWEAPRDIYLRHLNKVCDICRKYQVTPMIWGDMILRNAKAENLDAQLPENLKLCYWNYSSTAPENYEKDLEAFLNAGYEPIMTTSVYTYNTFCWLADKTEQVAPACIQACNSKGIRDLIISVWGDAGAFCNMTSALQGLLFILSTAAGETNLDVTREQFNLLTGQDYDLYRKADSLHRVIDGHLLPVPGLLWEDPLQGGAYSYCFTSYPQVMDTYLRDLQETCNSLKENILSDSLKELVAAMETQLCGLNCRTKLLHAYEQKNRAELLELAQKDYPIYLRHLQNFAERFRQEWLSTALPFGLEVIQRRNAGLAARIREAQRRLLEYLDGKCSRIEELDEAIQASHIPGFAPAPPIFSACLEVYA